MSDSNNDHHRFSSTSSMNYFRKNADENSLVDKSGVGQDINELLEITRNNESRDGGIASSAAVRLTNEKANRILKECQKTILDVKTSIEVNSGDQLLTFEENALRRVAAQEIEIAKMFSVLPYKPDMYNYKINQVNTMAKDRQKMEKILFERRLASGNTGKGKKGTGFDGDLDRPDKLSLEFKARKERVQVELRHALGGDVVDSEAYNQKIGFELCIDYILGIPAGQDSSQLTYGVFKMGQQICLPKVTEPHIIETTHSGMKSSYGERKNLSDVTTNELTMLFFELQLTSKMDKGEHTTNFGFTCIDLFSKDNCLKKGRYKLPFYPPPVDTTLIPDRFKWIRCLPDTFLYIRIEVGGGYDQAQGGGFNFFEDLASIGYKVPMMHTVKSDNDLDEDADNDILQEKQKRKEIEDQRDELKEMVDRQALRIEELMRLDEERYRTLHTGEQVIIGQLNKNPLDLPMRAGIAEVEEESEEEEEADAEPTDLDFVEKVRADPNDARNGLKVELISKRDQTGKDKIQVTCDVFYMKERLTDDGGDLMEYKSKEYETKNKSETNKAKIVFKTDSFAMHYNFK